MTTYSDNDPYVILFNGPPKSGKDTIAQALRPMLDSAWDIPSHVMHFATPMRDMAMGVLGEEGFDRYNEIKDFPQDILHVDQEYLTSFSMDEARSSDSIRQLMIALSENFMKFRYGKDIWGRILIDVYAKSWWGKKPSVILIPDLGFQDEYEYLLSKTNPSRVLVVQTLREGCSFDGDSRSYVKPESQYRLLSLVNNSTPREATIQVYQELAKLGWMSK